MIELALGHIKNEQLRRSTLENGFTYTAFAEVWSAEPELKESVCLLPLQQKRKSNVHLFVLFGWETFVKNHIFSDTCSQVISQTTIAKWLPWFFQDCSISYSRCSQDNAWKHQTCYSHPLPSSDHQPGNPFLKHRLALLPSPYTNRSFLVTCVSLLVIACDKLPPIKPGGVSPAMAAMGSPVGQSRLPLPSSSAGRNTARVHALQMPKDGLVQWSPCKGSLMLIF